MSITEDLRFSVLSAPLAATDRRALSQAWYSALYRPGATPVPQNRAPHVRGVEERTLTRAGTKEAPSGESIRSAPARMAHERRAAAVACGERRAPRLPLARKIALFVLRPRKKSGATFTIDGAHGRVRVMVRADGNRVRLIALCAQPLKATVSAALAQARYALAARGAGVSARVWEGEACS